MNVYLTVLFAIGRIELCETGRLTSLLICYSRSRKDLEKWVGKSSNSAQEKTTRLIGEL